MRTIYKYRFRGKGHQPAELHQGAIITVVHEQEGLPTIWYVCNPNPELDKQIRKFYIAATGEELPKGYWKYIGTAFCGYYVWHVFEEVEPGELVGGFPDPEVIHA